MPLGVDVGLGPGHIVLHGDQAPLPQKGAEPPNFRPMSIVAKWLDGSRCHLVQNQTSAQATLCWMGTPLPLHEGGTAHPSFHPMSIVATVAHLSYCWALVHLWNQARSLDSTAHIFTMTAPICIIFGALQCRVVLNISADFIFINCSIQSGTTWWNTAIHFWTTVCKTVCPMPSDHCLSCLWRWCIVAKWLDGSWSDLPWW